MSDFPKQKTKALSWRAVGWIMRAGVLVPILYAAFKLAGVVP